MMCLGLRHIRWVARPSGSSLHPLASQANTGILRALELTSPHKVTGGRPRAAAVLGLGALSTGSDTHSVMKELVPRGSHVRAIIHSGSSPGFLWDTAVSTVPSAPWCGRARWRWEVFMGSVYMCLIFNF